MTYTVFLDGVWIGQSRARTPLAAATAVFRKFILDDKRDPTGYMFEEHGPGWGRAGPGHSDWGSNGGNGVPATDNAMFVVRGALDENHKFDRWERPDCVAIVVAHDPRED